MRDRLSVRGAIDAPAGGILAPANFSDGGSHMRQWLRAACLPFVLALAACGGGGSSGPPVFVGSAPTANFSLSCSDLVCTFTSLSTDQDVGDAIVSQEWTFGDASPAVTTAVATHTFAAASTYNVTLRVTDRTGQTGTASRPVTVTAPPQPAAPHARFTVSCLSLACTFTDTSTYDAGSVFQSRVWDFGDAVTLAATNPATHTYAATALTTYTVKLSVTDAAGKTSTSVQSIAVAPPATTLGCVSGNCTLNLAQASRVTATILSHSCSAEGNRVVITSPVTQTIFANGCFDPIGVPVAVDNGTVFAAGTTLQVSVLSGSLTNTSLVFTPSLRVTGDFTNGWTLTFDDGYGGAGEPDFNDLVILLRAIP
ncbi:MAG TPA: PKD domain-containing protein [Caldimonas sp.]|nr:PKD domain-containing protein [Caldimonas sp.]HEX2541493.1 PKD domain-containing protein [Caldimonas sp.]